MTLRPLPAMLLLSAIAVAGWLMWQPTPMEEASVAQDVAAYEVSRVVRFAFKVSNQSTRALDHATLWAYGPVGLTSTQRVEAVDSETSLRILPDPWGNQVFQLELGTLPPHGVREVRFLVRLSLASRPNRVPLSNPESFLGNSPLLETDAPAIRQLAVTLKAESPIQTAQNTFDWVADNIRYTGYARSALGAAYALQQRQGDCTEFAMLFTALMRANGLPARVLGGFMVDEDSLLQARDYHNWAEFYLHGRWHIADPQQRVFMRKYSEYVAFRIDASADEKQCQAGRFGTTPDGLLAVMY